ncbi:hypothetical protein BCR34DRAFT_589996 [Clohesyomyces aquaticus]|uniref:C2H2-type domain-containing protein n=1 Tax=Clohesyomyces aquaticus TaxID=1231657 RepID=A0A1Y1ZET1_9PLEO|nr:hypothetical protein BCR34DRAFT_589996 [Clohesyomyces aquaticus]
MSGYQYSSGQSGYGYPTSSVPQYTQAQIDQYYQQYQQYPPQPYQVIQYDYNSYTHPMPTGYTQPQMHVPGTAYTGAADTSLYYSTPVAQAGGGSQSEDRSRSAPPNQTTLRRRRMKIDRRIRSSSRGRTWTCDVPNCTSTANFTRLADLQRHQSTVHGMGSPEFPCTVPRCTRVGDKGFTRRDHLVEHLRNFHHLDIPKRKAGERSANPSGAPYY